MNFIIMFLIVLFVCALLHPIEFVKFWKFAIDRGVKFSAPSHFSLSPLLTRS